MLKRLLLLCTLLLVVALAGMGQSVTIDKIRYEVISPTEAALVDGYKAEGEIILPKNVMIGGKQYEVTKIADYAFKKRKQEMSFYGSKKLRSITIPESVKSIGIEAFEYCESLVDVIMKDGVITIGNNAFRGCKSLSSVIMSNNLSEIGTLAFCRCYKLKEIVVPDFEPVQYEDFWSDFSSETVSMLGHNGRCPNWIIDYIISNSLDDENLWTKWAAEKQKSEDYAYNKNVQADLEKKEDKSVELTKNETEISEFVKGDTPATYQQEITLLPSDETIEDENEDKNKFGDVDVNIPSSTQTSSNTFAVIIGNENYSQVAKVPYALNDAKTFATYCQKTLGLPQKNIRTYMDATFGIMLSAIENIQGIAKAYKGNINVIFYYAGHGLPNEESKDAFLLPVDASGRNTLACYATNKLYEELAGLGAKSVTVFMDACFSGAQRGEGMLASARGVAIKPRDVEPKGNMVVFSAASADETAYPYTEKGHGLFTYFLLKKLQESKGNATLGELGSYIREKVSQESIVTNGKSQTPTVVSSAALGDGWKNMRLK